MNGPHPLPVDLGPLADLGVDHVELRAVLAGGRWHIDGQWVGHRPDRPQTLATETSGHFEHQATLADVLERIAADAASSNEDYA